MDCGVLWAILPRCGTYEYTTVCFLVMLSLTEAVVDEAEANVEAIAV